ncbi:MAG TPA: UDP-N-acetylmuramoyl-L-alanine--D-glutamate ligase [Bdellovibrionales bacterium]|nr:UDP-N-acetylmuramoyl-L-alanine--D-glutamate ligase [Bdellovibrionales bacterium]
MDVKGKRILVVGLSKTGVSLAHFLNEQGAQVTVSDHKSEAELTEALEQLSGLDIKFDLGGHTPKTFIEQDLIVLSPGVSPELKIFDYARHHGVKVTNELELAASFVQEPMIAITGTNGKSTVAALCEAFLRNSGVNVWLGGNFGTPLTEYVRSKEKAQVVIVEVSSYQLELVEKFNPRVIVLTNIAENHLDRHRSMEEYVLAKKRIFMNTNHGTTSVLNADDNMVVDMARDPLVQRGRIFYFSRKPALEPQIMNIGGAVTIKNEVRIRLGPEIERLYVDKMKMRGRHSIENIMAAVLATREFGAKLEVIQDVINSFPGLPHRIEYVRKAGGVEFYNDSKATNVHAVMRALDAFEENVILIMGGKDTNANFEPLIDPVKRKVKSLILTGETKERINRAIGDFSETFLIGTFEEAVLVAYQKSRIGDTILLSPGCPSFDLFDNFEERGDYYKRLVKQFQ